MIRPAISPTRGSASPSSSPAEQADDGAAAGPSVADPDSFDVQRAAVGRALAAGQSPSRRRGRPPLSESGAEVAAKRARLSLEASADPELSRALQRLKTVCNSKEIVIKDSLYRLLNDCSHEHKVSLINKIAHYFTHVNPALVKDTMTISSMMGAAAAAGNIRKFVQLDDQAIEWVAKSDYIKSISCMCSSKGFPKRETVEAFLALPCLQKDGSLDKQLLKSISSMFSSKGIPEGGDLPGVANLLSLEVLQRDGVLDKALLGSISSMCGGRKLPDNRGITRLLSLPCLKTDADPNQGIDQRRLGSLASMHNRKGLPDSAAVEALFGLPCLKTNGAFDQRTLTFISSVCSGKKIPNLDAVKTLLELDCLKDEQQQLNQTALRCLASMHKAKGLPDAQKVIGLMAINDLKALQFIASLYHQRCIPEAAELNRLMSLRALQAEGGGLDYIMFSHVAALGRGKGFPSTAILNQASTKRREAFAGAPVALPDEDDDEQMDSDQDDMETEQGTSSAAAAATARAQEHSAVRMPEFRSRAELRRAELSGEEKTELESARQRLMSLCQRKKITVKGDLLKAIEACPDVQKTLLIDRMARFFASVRTGIVDSTQILTSMLGPTHVARDAFLNMSDDDIDYIANSSQIKHIANICAQKGLPKAAAVRALFELDCLQRDGQVDGELLKPIANMYHSKEFPTAQSVKDLLAMPAFQVNGELDLKLLNSVAYIQYGRGLPDASKLEAFLALAALKTDDGGFDYPKLRSITSILRTKGIPDPQQLNELLSMAVFKTAGKFDLKWFSPVSSMLCSRGLPEVSAVRSFFAIPALNPDGETNMQLLKSVSSMNNGRGFPDPAAVDTLMNLPALKVNGRLSLSLFSSIAAMCNGKGVPDPQQVQTLLTTDELYTAHGKVNAKVLASLSSLCHSRGLPERTEIQRLLSLLKRPPANKVDEKLLKVFSALYHARGFPSTSDVTKLLSRVSPQGSHEPDLQLLRKIASLGARKGFPSKTIINNAMAAIGRGELAPDDSDDDDEMMAAQASTSAAFADELPVEFSTDLDFWSALRLPEAPQSSAPARPQSPSLLGTARSYLAEREPRQ